MLFLKASKIRYRDPSRIHAKHLEEQTAGRHIGRPLQVPLNYIPSTSISPPVGFGVLGRTCEERTPPDPKYQNSRGGKYAPRPHIKRRGDNSTVLMTALSLILLAFFILLYTLSSPNKQKQRELALEIQQAFQSIGGVWGNIGGEVGSGRGRQEQVLDFSHEVETLLSQLQGYIESDESLDEFSYEIRDESFSLHIPTDFGFPSGEATIKASAHDFLNTIFDFIIRTENRVRIEGHTDDIPFQSEQFGSNWELSAARAASVLRFFMEQNVIDRSRFSAAGYSKYHPIASNRFSNKRAENRRVTIVLVGKIRYLGGPLGTGD